MTATAPIYEGGCHCGAARYRLQWPWSGQGLPARRCTCTFCLRFNGTWTSHPDASLELIENPSHPLTRYRFATGTADFLFCSRCGVMLVAISEAGGTPRAVVNVNTLGAREELDWERGDSDFDGESLVKRLDRRADRWIGKVLIRSADQG